jgi:hypothetical protein
MAWSNVSEGGVRGTHENLGAHATLPSLMALLSTARCACSRVSPEVSVPQLLSLTSETRVEEDGEARGEAGDDEGGSGRAALLERRSNGTEAAAGLATADATFEAMTDASGQRSRLGARSGLSGTDDARLRDARSNGEITGGVPPNWGAPPKGRVNWSAVCAAAAPIGADKAWKEFADASVVDCSAGKQNTKAASGTAAVPTAPAVAAPTACSSISSP